MLDASSEALFDAIILGARARNFIRNSVAMCYNWTLGWVGSPIEYVKIDEGVPINGPRLAREMFKFHAKQVREKAELRKDTNKRSQLTKELSCIASR